MRGTHLVEYAVRLLIMLPNIWMNIYFPDGMCSACADVAGVQLD